MDNIELLEAKWHAYQLKKRLPWYNYVLLVLLAFSYLQYRETIGHYAQGLFLDMNETQLVVADPLSTQELKTASSTNITTDDSNTSVVNDDGNKMKIELSDEIPPKEHERKFINIIVTDNADVNGTNDSSGDDLKIVEQRYEKNQTYDDALYLATNYYTKGNFEKSAKWSLAANNLNVNSEESWIVFAKSKAKLGQNRDAIKLLEAYLKENNSEKAQVLLEKLMSGAKID